MSLVGHNESLTPRTIRDLYSSVFRVHSTKGNLVHPRLITHHVTIQFFSFLLSHSLSLSLSLVLSLYPFRTSFSHVKPEKLRSRVMNRLSNTCSLIRRNLESKEESFTPTKRVGTLMTTRSSVVHLTECGPVRMSSVFFV